MEDCFACDNCKSMFALKDLACILSNGTKLCFACAAAGIKASQENAEKTHAVITAKLEMLAHFERMMASLQDELVAEIKRMEMPLDEKLKLIAASGHKVFAIKLYRETTSASLRESKEYVDKLCGG